MPARCCSLNCHPSILVAVFLLVVSGCNGAATSDGNSAGGTAATGSASPDPWWREMTSQSALNFVHQVGRFEDYEMPAIMGSGCSVVDFDRDGLLDLYLVNGNPRSDGAPPNDDRGDGFFRRDAAGRYHEIAGLSGIRLTEFGMGAWWGDYDADGFPDLFLSNVGANRLFHNQGDGTFQQIDLPAGVVERAWSTAAAWCDVNSDGLLDLVVVNYVDYLPGQYCEGAGGQRDFCGPSAYPGTVDRLLVNLGESAAYRESPFRDETIARGFGNKRGRGLGVLAADLNADNRLDIYVANDMEANHLWIQQGDGSFEEQADLLGTARNFLGEVEASMGIVSGDWNQDDLPDLFVTHLAGETNTLYQGIGPGLWQDATVVSGLGPPGLPYTSFGIADFDVEHDGDVDFLIANGGVKRDSTQAGTSDPQTIYRQLNSLYLRDNDSFRFQYQGTLGGEFTSTKEISRGLATGDLDGDGDLDLLLSNCSGQARLFENIAPKTDRHWLMLRLIDQSGNRDAIGARVKLFLEKDRWISRQVSPYAGYLASNDPALHFGLGPIHHPLSIQITWPGGEQEVFDDLPADTHLTVIRGQGIFPQLRPSEREGVRIAGVRKGP